MTNFLALTSLILYFQSSDFHSSLAVFLSKYTLYKESVKPFMMWFLYRKSKCFQASITLMTRISHSSSLCLGASSVKNLVKFKVVRWNNIFHCYLLKLSLLNFSSFSLGETEIDIEVGITGFWAIIGVAIWANAVGTTFLES